VQGRPSSDGSAPLIRRATRADASCARGDPRAVRPALLVAPTSVVANWEHEIQCAVARRDPARRAGWRARPGRFRPSPGSMVITPTAPPPRLTPREVPRGGLASCAPRSIRVRRANWAGPPVDRAFTQPEAEARRARLASRGAAAGGAGGDVLGAEPALLVGEVLAQGDRLEAGRVVVANAGRQAGEGHVEGRLVEEDQ